MGRFELERRELVGMLKEKGITDETVLAAIGTVERHLFVDPMFVNRAYEDSALPIGSEQTISQPFTVAFMSQALRPRKGMKVLEIGTGSGYQAAVLAAIGCRVFTIERHLSLLMSARKLFDVQHLRIVAKGGDGSIGWSEHAPYDGIIVTAGAPSIPGPLAAQLAEGGRIVIPVGGMEAQRLHVATKVNGLLQVEVHDGFKFVPLIGKNAWN
ncbi:MAG: protein-L-isoaspartate(D-aspartate) O-methyltransferase [Bacteroidetes bacterium]|nr:MAG: protein-L-isoaspartate(D-aspartate) O-methyltransferase [Bacteroidota bacterium]